MKIKTPEKRGGVQFIFKWGSHQPVVNAMVELISPKLIVELGVGRYSTPIFLKFKAEKILHIDNDSGWLELVKKENADNITDKSEFRHHDLSKVNINKLNILPSELDQDQKNFIDRYYKDLYKEIETMNYKSSIIFTDGFASCRKSSVDILTEITDALIFHDAEEPKTYGYDSLNQEIHKTHDEYLLKTSTSWTGFFIRKGIIDFKNLNILLDKHINKFVEDLGITKEGFKLIQMPSKL